MGAGAPAKQAMRWMAPALPVFAGMPAPTMAVGRLLNREQKKSRIRRPSLWCAVTEGRPPGPR
ncbi:hypothetical protein C6A77_20770 [Pseudomonas sp. AFG_SD02_1510_Pfu_092]|nr:hypothetical protein C6A77_20770 [Pseudomonas sp. AFG_SD02_1510_Pfu_092]